MLEPPDPSQLQDAPQPRRRPQLQVLSDLPGCRTQGWLGDSLEGPSWRTNVKFSTCRRPQVLLYFNCFEPYLVTTQVGQHIVCVDVLWCIMNVKTTHGYRVFFIFSIFRYSAFMHFLMVVTKFDQCPYSGHCRESNSATIDLTCCSKACDAKLVVRLKD